MGGTLGRLMAIPLLNLPASDVPSFDFCLLMRVLGRFSALFFAAGLASLVGASVGVAMAPGSSFGELGVFDDECLR